MADEEEEKPFAIERAKSGRAKCKKCKCPLEKDAVRIAKLVSNPFSEGSKMKAWHHLSCLFEVFAKQRASTKRIEDPEEDISGWDSLPEEDKKLVLEKLEEFEKSSPLKTTKPKATAKKKEIQTTPKKMAVTPTASPGKKKTPKDASRKEENRVTVEDHETSELDDKIAVGNKDPTKDDLFREFRRICANVANVDAYTEKTAIIKKMFTHGSSGGEYLVMTLWKIR
ncbi:hypothetical protein KPH14_002305 [Odynerus spinipes]|uniref:PARP-type domain-containing protein n=1 Tax=Odynerus spinipes TaxID=1348599 RepID=A0AAD9VPE1_9HYME|nr:hypothetical protein KPH14_002305 [Odynerus spinipes]